MPDHIQKVTIENTGLVEVGAKALKYAIAPIHPFGRGEITDNGKQWSAEVSTADGEYTDVEEVEIDLGSAREILEIEVALTLQLKSSGATKDAMFRWAIKYDSEDYVYMCPLQTYGANASVYKEYTMSGRLDVSALPSVQVIKIKAVIIREDATENVTAQCSNSSYISILIN